MTYYVAVDIGCIECGESSAVLGIFTDQPAAEAACERAEAKQAANWRGQHSFEVFEIAELNKERDL